MSRPLLDMATSFAVRGRHSLSAVATGSPGNIRRCCWPSPDALPCARRYRDRLYRLRTITAISSTSCPKQASPRGQGNARHPGWRHVSASCCHRYVHVVSICRWTRPHCITNKTGDLQPALSLQRRHPAGRSPAIPGTWKRTSHFFARSTPGTSVCRFILMSTASLPPVASLPVTPDGSPLATPSSFPSRCSAVSSAVSSSPDLRPPSA